MARGRVGMEAEMLTKLFKCKNKKYWNFKGYPVSEGHITKSAIAEVKIQETKSAPFIDFIPASDLIF